jgi:hypothetical protein
MVISNLAAWTPGEPNPPYLSINHCQNKNVTISIRERGNDALGNTASVVLTEDEFQDVLNQLKRNINRKNNNVLLIAVKACYLKHHLNSDAFGWDEISEILQNALCNELGDKGYQDWLSSVKK